MRTFYFKQKMRPFDFTGHTIVLAKTELGEIKIEDNRLFIPIGYDNTFTYMMVYYVYNFDKRCWSKKRGLVVQKLSNSVIKVTYNELFVYDMLFFTMICTPASNEFDDETLTTMKKQFLRERRERDCYPIVNRGKLWYDMLTYDQVTELDKWYKEWLNVTDTLVIPKDLDWVNNKLEEEELL